MSSSAVREMRVSAAPSLSRDPPTASHRDPAIDCQALRTSHSLQTAVKAATNGVLEEGMRGRSAAMS